MKAFLSTYIRHAAMVLMILSMALSGCASKYGNQTTKVNYYPQCYKPIGDMREDESSTNKATAGGAVGGALLGALIGGLATGKVSGAVIGAAAGGATGAVAGNVYGKSQEKKRGQQQLAAYMQQLDGESASMDRATAAAKVAAKCYDTQFQQAAAAVKAGQMDKPEFSRRYEEIRSGLEETSRILKSTSNAMAEKDAQYQKVLAEEQAAQPAPPVVQAKTSTKKASAQVAPTPPQRGQNVQQSTAKWDQSRAELNATQQGVDTQMQQYAKTVAALDM